jgi:nucleoside 2-deoxyribosyltransferase
MTLRLYLCGNVAGRSAKAMREERQAASQAICDHGWQPVDPIAGEYDALKRRRNIQDDQSALTAANICLKDRYLIDGSDILLWLTADVASYGSCIEVGYAWAKGIPIIAVDTTKRGRKSAFVAHICTCIASTLEDALDFVAQYMALMSAPERGAWCPDCVAPWACPPDREADLDGWFRCPEHQEEK